MADADAERPGGATDGGLDAIERRLVWIMGSPRSGSSWLLRLLAHPWHVAETATGLDRPRLSGPRPDVVPVNESYLPNHLALTPGPRRSLVWEQRADQPAYFFSAAYRASWEPALRALILGRFAAQEELARREHGLREPWIVIKEPNGSHGAELIARTLPRCRLVFLLRDGRDVVDSMLDADSPGGWRTRREGVIPVATPEQRMGLIERESLLWLRRTAAVESACEMLGPERVHRVRYEDLLADTPGELGRLDDWIGIGRSPARIRAAARAQRFGSLRNRLRARLRPPAGMRAATPGLWRENMDGPERERLGELLNEKLAQLGYPL